MEPIEKKKATMVEQGILVPAEPKTTDTPLPVKKKKPLILYVVLAIGGVVIISGACDRFFSGKTSVPATSAAENQGKIVALLPPPPQPVAATTTAVPEGTPSKKPMTKIAVAEWVNNLRKAIMSPALSDNVKLDQVAESWLTAKLMGMNAEATIAHAVAHNGGKPIHVLHSGTIDNQESALVDKLAPVAGVKELVSSTLYDGVGIYVHPLTVDKCHVVIVMQAKTAMPARSATWGSAANLFAAPCTEKAGHANSCPASESLLKAGQSPVSSVTVAAKKDKSSKFPVPMPPPAFGGHVVDVPPPTKTSQVKDDYEVYPDLKNKTQGQP